MVEEFLTLGDAAKYLGVSRTTLRQRILEGKLRPVKNQADTREKFIAKSELDALKSPKARAALAVA